MTNIQNEQTVNANSQTATAENELGESKRKVSLGKFKTTEALFNAYNALQAEFTKRCQRIKELEKPQTSVSNHDNSVDGDQTKTNIEAEKIAKADPELPSEQTLNQDSKNDDSSLGITEKDREEILIGYLKNLLTGASSAIVLDGVGTDISSPVSRPKTVAEASRLAKEYFK